VLRQGSNGSKTARLMLTSLTPLPKPCEDESCVGGNGWLLREQLDHRGKDFVILWEWLRGGSKVNRTHVGENARGGEPRPRPRVFHRSEYRLEDSSVRQEPLRQGLQGEFERDD